MCDTLNGLLSGKYDSTKQRAVLLNGDRLRNYRSYTATMRMELLLTGHLVFTDAQFFDGLYFHWLAKSAKEFEAFKGRMVSFEAKKGKKKLPPFSFAVKCRGTEAGPRLPMVVFKMYCKQFQFSSIEQEDLAKAVFELSSDFSEAYFTGYDEEKWNVLNEIISSKNNAGNLTEMWGEKYAGRFRKLVEKTQTVIPFDEDVEKSGIELESYIKTMEDLLKNYKGEKSSIANSWVQYAEGLRTLFNIEGLIDRWGSSDGKWPPNFKMEKCLDQPFSIEPYCTYREEMKRLLDQAEGREGMGYNPIAKRFFSRIRDELARNIGNRSKITTSLDELALLNNLDKAKRGKDCWQRVQNCFNEFRQLMNDRYNKALAEQHGCGFLDLCDYKNTTKQLSEAVVIQEIIIKSRLVKALAELPWDDFLSQIEHNETDLKNEFDAWISAYRQSSAYDVKSALEKYLDRLAELITSPTSGSIVTEAVGPWDRDGTCNETIRAIVSKNYQYPYYFIGGGSFEEGSSKGNEICILCVGKETSTEEMTIIRLRLDKNTGEDTKLDTLLAPVSNPLNGGAL